MEWEEKLEIFRNQLKQLQVEDNIIIGQVIYVEEKLKPRLKQLDFTDSDFLNILRYLKGKKYLMDYTRTDGFDVQLTSEGYEWLTNKIKEELIELNPEFHGIKIHLKTLFRKIFKNKK